MSPRIAQLMTLWDDGQVTMDELFACLTSLLSDDPSELPFVRAALEGRPEISGSFEAWLRDLADRPSIAFSSGTYVIVSNKLIEVLAKEEEEKRLFGESRGG